MMARDFDALVKKKIAERDYFFAAATLRGAPAFGFRGSNSKTTLPFSSFKRAEKGRPFFEMNFGSKSVLPVAINFCACSWLISRCKIILPIRKVQVFAAASVFSQE
jgi:hypothetical protein